MADSPTIGKAYVQIVPSAQGIKGKVQNVLDPEATKAGQSAGSKLSAGLSKAVSGIGTAFTNIAAGGAAAIAGISAAVTQTALKGGISRAIGLDDARAKFKQLGFDVEGMMASVDASVTGTRYSMDQAASVAVNFGSAGVKAGDDMTNALKSVASVASIAGVDFEQMGAIYTKVASKGRLTGEVMSQLSENGINASAALAKAYGVNMSEVAAIVESGEVTFEIFADAMREYFGDAAMSANTTFSGAMANVRANLGRLGAAFMSPALEGLRVIFAGTSEDTVGLIGAIKAVINALQPAIDAFTKFAEVVGAKVANAFNAFAVALENTGSAAQAFKAFFADLIPDSLMAKIEKLSPEMQSFLGVLGKIGGLIAGVGAGWGVFSGAVTMLAPGLARLLGPLMSVGGGFKLIQTLLQALAGPIGIVIGAFGLMFATSEKFRNATIGLAQGIGASLLPLLRTIAGVVLSIMPVITSMAKTLGDALAPVIVQLTPIIQVAIGKINLLAKVIGAIAIPVFKVAGKAISAFGSVLAKIVAVVLKVYNSIQTTFIRIKLAIVRPINSAKNTIVGLVNKIKSIFPLHLGKIFSGSFKLPHIKITSKGEAPWGFGGFGKKPTWKIDWYAKGGIMESPTLFGGGEAGAEAIVPLDPFWSRLDKMADNIENSNSGDITINVYAGQQDAKEIAVEVEKRLIDAQKRRRLAWA